MTTVSIPSWNNHGVLPPIRPNFPGHSPHRSPYKASLLDMVLRFSTTPERRTILKGLLDFRSLLHASGLQKGFQWINGSFVENVELLQNRVPKDIDVVNFINMPKGETEQTLWTKHPEMFDHDRVKQKYHIDSYYLFLDAGHPEPWTIESAVYWYSMWSHQRSSYAWKGFLQIDLDPVNDDESRKNLLVSGGGA